MSVCVDGGGSGVFNGSLSVVCGLAPGYPRNVWFVLRYCVSYQISVSYDTCHQVSDDANFVHENNNYSYFSLSCFLPNSTECSPRADVKHVYNIWSCLITCP